MEQVGYSAGDSDSINNSEKRKCLGPPDTVKQVKRICRVLMDSPEFEGSLNREDSKNLEKIWVECCTRWRTHPRRRLPASSKRWHRIVLMTFELPQSTTNRKNSPANKMMARLLFFIVDVLNMVLGEGGKYVLGIHIFGHRGTDNRYPRLHFHVVCSAFRFHASGKKWRKGGSKAKVWSQSEDEVAKLAEMKEFFGPEVDVRGIIDELNTVWCEKMKLLFGKDCLVEGEQLIWTSGVISGKEACIKIAAYGRNPAPRAVADLKIRYRAKTKTVKIWHLNEDGTVTNPVEFPVLEFARRFLLIPMRGFHHRLCSQGCWSGNSSFRPVLELIRINDKAWKAAGWSENEKQPQLTFKNILSDMVERDFPLK